MKQLFAILMSLHFMLQPLQGMAAETKEQSNDASGVFVSGTESSNPIYDGEISQLLDGYRLYAYQTLSFSTAIVGASIATMCGAALKVPSVAAFEVGSLAYVMKEIVDGKKQNAHHKEMLDKVKAIKERTGGMENGDVQKEILSQHRDEELHKRDLIKSRVTWLKAVTVMYEAATILAAGEEFAGMIAGAAAGFGACSGIAAQLATPCGVTYPACFAAHMAACTPLYPTGTATAKANFMTSASVPMGNATCAAAGVYAGGCAAMLNTYLAIAHPFCTSVGSMAGIGYILSLTAAYNIGFATKNPHNYMAMLTALLMVMVPALNMWVVPFYNYPFTVPFGRVATFGVSTALVGVVIQGLNRREKLTEENLVKLAKTVDQFVEDTKDDQGVKKGDVDKTDLMNKASPTGRDIKPNMKITTLPDMSKKSVAIKGSCMARVGDRFEFSPQACANTLQINRPSGQFKGVNPKVVEATKLGADMTQAFADGDLVKSNSLAAEIEKLGPAVNEALADAKSKLNAQLKASGAKPMDFDKNMNDQLKGMDDILNNSAKEAKVDMRTLASLNGSLPGAQSSNAAAVSGTNGLDAEALAAKNLINNGQLNGAGSTISEGGQAADDGANSATGNDQNGNQSRYGNVQDKTGKDGITSDRDESLFHIVSQRYIRSLDRLLNRKQPMPDDH